jgi:carboxyl-terminal processing protease
LPMDTTIDIDKDVSKIEAGSYLKTTVSQLYRVNGTTAQAKGVLPDIELPDLLQAHPRREANEPNVLISSPVESSKYFKPYNPIAITGLQAAAKTEVDASPYFRFLKNYINEEKLKSDKEDINLKLSEVIEDKKQSMQKNTPDSNAIKNEKASYKVESNSFEKQQMLVDERLKELNEQWTGFLSEDPYLRVAYDVILLMIK